MPGISASGGLWSQVIALSHGYLFPLTVYLEIISNLEKSCQVVPMLKKEFPSPGSPNVKNLPHLFIMHLFF